ncbi:MAG TPA: hypothetical protein V6D19_18595, partial [Stenomitos sp.]
MSEEPNIPQEPTPSQGMEDPVTPAAVDPPVAASETPPASVPVNPTPAAKPSASRAKSSTQVPKSPSAAAPTASTSDQVLKTAQQTWTKVQPVLQERSIQALLLSNRFTNHFLDNIWPKLSRQAIAAVPASAKSKVEVQKAKLQPTLDKLQPVWNKAVLPFWRQAVVPTWMKGLAFLRQRLPEVLKKELTDRFLTVAILTTLVVVYWFFSSLTAGSSATAKQPPAPTKPVLTRPVPSPVPVAQRPAVSRPSPSPVAPSPIAVKPSVASPSPVAVPPSPVAAPRLKPDQVPIVESPKPTPPVVSSVPKPAPSPALDLADLQAQLTGAVAGVADDLVVSVKAVDVAHPLQVSASPAWYQLSAADQ